ncbi:hypothetical protein [Mariniblastus fucicola]|uniref:HTTM domain-containing protein n=1 Tax=Mariniblastus fucicola TaxID=980251 RepID=A0A5B9PFF1_9BACT|nr:hypothetical protein [Mariniblastus fucicola]QEG23925.1 hypothetical protein MFFC18_38300 [Mariniblastus fucicola]
MLSSEADKQIAGEGETLSLLKLVHAGILVSLIWKVRFYWFSLGVNEQYPLVDPFFPDFFRSQFVLVAAYAIATTCSALTIFIRAKRPLLLLGCGSVVGLSILCVHQNAYNDVTFLTCAWTSLWCLWLTTRLGESFQTLYPRAAWLSHVILSLIFLGGTIGKLTPGYWSGEVLHEIYFKGRDFWTYNLLRESMTEAGLREFATWHSRMVLVSESICAFLWLMPRKVASIVAMIVLCGIALTNNLSLFSVVTCLIGLSLVGLHDTKRTDSIPEAQQRKSRSG